MARNGLAGRERVCVACENPSPGPIKLLYYRWRLHGPFFPLLERLKNEENTRLFVNGRVPVCTSCASYLLRQWNEYERKNISLPIEKRTYRLLTDERWDRINRKKQLGAAERRIHERAAEILNYDENENELPEIPSPVESLKPPFPSKSKIPRLARREKLSEKTPDTSLGIMQGEIASEHEIDSRVRTAASKMADEQRSKLLRKMAEIKFEEELDYIQKKVQKTMGMVHLKGREERIREIELELEGKIDNPRNGPSTNEKMSASKAIMPIQDKESISELKQYIEKEMAVQRLEMDILRNNIKSEIAQAMDESYRRNEEFSQFIQDMNERQRNGRRPRKNRPYSDGDSLNTLPKPNRRTERHERMSDDYEDTAESDRPYNEHR